MTLNEQRQGTADQAFELYDMGDMEVKDTGGWDTIDKDEWNRAVFIEGAEGEDGCGTSTKLMFVVRFVPGSVEVSEAYFAE